jgi:hypothetical protein
MSSSLSLQPQASPAALYPSLPPSQELEKPDPTTAPEVKKGLDRFIPNQLDIGILLPQVDKHKLSDFLQHPTRNLGVFAGLLGSSILGITFIFDLQKSLKLKQGMPSTLALGATFAGVAFSTINHYIHQDMLNKDMIQGIGILGENATRQEWIHYKKTHPNDYYIKQEYFPLQDVQTLGENATRQEWLDYKKTHPEIKQA